MEALTARELARACAQDLGWDLCAESSIEPDGILLRGAPSHCFELAVYWLESHARGLARTPRFAGHLARQLALAEIAANVDAFSLELIKCSGGLAAGDPSIAAHVVARVFA